jgi:diguanylate cyclase (GGDEF)-like protein
MILLERFHEYKIYIKVKWVTRISGLIFMSIFLATYVPQVADTSFVVIDYIIIILLFVCYMFSIAAIPQNNLLSSTLIISIVFLFQVYISIRQADFEILYTYVLYMPGLLSLGSYMFTQRSYKYLSSRLAEVEQKHKISLEMLQITPNLITSSDLDEVLQKILAKAVDIMPKAQMGSIILRHGDTMKFHAAVGYDMQILKAIDLKPEEMFQYKLGILNEPSIMRDIKTFNRENMQYKKFQTMEESKATIAKSILTSPLRIKDKIYGFINLDNSDDYDAFDEKDKIYIKHLASQIDLAINNHLLVEDIYKLSRYDKLTDTYSRQYNQELMQRIKTQAEKSNEIFTTCVIDINDLKKVNDKYGHDAGDRYLRQFCYVVKKHLSDDMVFARTGGDEFMITMPNKRPLEASKIIDNIRGQLFKSPLNYSKLVIPVTFGCGFAVFPKDAKEINKLIEIADKHMYNDKDIQKNTALS